MKNVDVEIYMNQFISFFENNPTDLIDLIGNENKEDFFKRVKNQCFINAEKGDDIQLTRQQLIEIVVTMNKSHVNTKNIECKILRTKFGDIFLN